MCAEVLHAQDTTTYCQAGAHLYSDCYTFVKQQKGIKTGTFVHEILTDDFGVTRVYGTFVEAGSFIRLHFTNSPNYKTHKAFKRKKSGLVPANRRGPVFKPGSR